MGMSRRGPQMVLALAALVLFVSQADAAMVVLTWTAPGDDGAAGTAAQYDLRYSTSPITTLSFPLAQSIESVPAPQPAGTREQFTAEGVPSGTVYFALRARDEAGNWSAISNVAQIAAVLDVDPGLIAEPSFSNPWPAPAREKTTFSLRLPQSDVVRIHILDVAGRAIHTLSDGAMPAGEATLTWDLRDDSGTRVAPGVYFARASFLGREWARRVVVIQ